MEQESGVAAGHMTGLLVLITGTGRSGTSTMSGTLHHLGLNVPGPHLGANESNPKGFFESRWSVRFHNELCARANISIYDGRPDAFDLLQATLTADDRDRLGSFLDKKAVGNAQTVVKDPRTVWAQGVWREVAGTRGLDTRFISMLRHPAEVVASRATYYSGADAESEDAARERDRFANLNIARWINNSILNERQTRGSARAFVRYTDLLEDWRPVLLRLQEELGLSYDVDVASGTPCAVDEFIDAGLRRHEGSWEGLRTPPYLREIAEAVWQDLQLLSDNGGVDEAASARLDRLAEQYRRVFDDASSIAHDERDAAVRAERRTKEAAPAPAAAPAVGEPRVSEVGGRELIRLAGQRAWRRLRG
jgi:hypothetical protein